MPPEAIGYRRYPPPVRRDEQRQLRLGMSLQQPQQAAQCAPLKIAAGFIGALRSSRKNVVDRHDYRCGLTGTIPVDWPWFGIVRSECPLHLPGRTEMPIVHAEVL